MTERDYHSAAEAGTFEIGGDLKVNRLGFGAMRLTGSLVWDDSAEPKDREGARRVLRRALEFGINLIDTADFYGPEANENLIREALYPYPEGVSVATKGGLVLRGRGDWGSDGSPKHLREACEASMERLGVEQIGLYQFHSPDPDVPFEESIGALAELRTEGKIRHLGVSNVSLDQLETARNIVPIASVQNRYSIAKRDAEELVDACESAGIAFLPYRPLATGNLDGLGGPLARIADDHGVTTKQVALAWLLHRSPVIVPIPGTTSVDHLEENVAATGIPLMEAEIKTLGAA